MTRSTQAALAILILISCTHGAMAGCADALTSHDFRAKLPVPAPCRAFGPLHLGMTHAEMVAALGRPDLESSGTAPMEAWYEFPRHLAARLRKHPEPMTFIYKHTGDIRIIFDHDKVVSIIASASSSSTIPYSVGGISINDPIKPLLRRVKTPPGWNASKDNILFDPYPFEISIDPDTQRIISITITTQAMIFGPFVMVHWVKDPDTGLVRGYNPWFSHS